LDIGIFFTKPLRRSDPITRLSLYRVAPLQVCLSEEGLGAGLPNSDLLIVDGCPHTPYEPGSAVGSIATLPYSGVPFARSHGRPSTTCQWDRADLGIPADAVVFASLAPFRLISPETLRVWCTLLQQAPQARMLVYSYAPEDSTRDALGALYDAVASACTETGIDPNRFILSNEKFPTLAEVLALLRLADIYLDSFPAGSLEGCQLALEAGVPLLCARGIEERQHPLAGPLVAMGFGKCACAGEVELAAQAILLAQDSLERQGLTDAFKAQLANPVHVRDLVARGEAIGADKVTSPVCAS
jgi:predicted O-linked N-acetylglucosamine transferase (SPINDLY family)